VTEAWAGPRVRRAGPGRVLGEGQALAAGLDYHRDTLLHKGAGLTAGQLQERAVRPSRLSLPGLARHMAEAERWWFGIHAADTDMALPDDPGQAGQDFEELDDADAAASRFGARLFGPLIPSLASRPPWAFTAR
jgi:hypothetical protein